MTFAESDKADWKQIQLVVRADAGAGLPPFAFGDRLARYSIDQRPLVLVDIRDRDIPALRRRAADREQTYLSIGWTKLGTDPLTGRVEHFLRLTEQSLC